MGLKKRRESKRESKFGINPSTGKAYTKKQNKRKNKYGLNEDGSINSKRQEKFERKSSMRQSKDYRMTTRADTDAVLAKDYGIDARGDRMESGFSFAKDIAGMGASIGMNAMNKKGEFNSSESAYASDDVSFGSSSTTASLPTLANPMTLAIVAILALFGFKMLKK